MELTIQDCQNAIVFLERVDLKGKESQAHTELLIKIKFIGQKIADDNNAKMAAAQAALSPPPAEVPPGKDSSTDKGVDGIPPADKGKH